MENYNFKDLKQETNGILNERVDFIQYLLVESLTIQKSGLCNFKNENFSFTKFEIYWHNFSVLFRNEKFVEILFGNEVLFNLLKIILDNFEVYLIYLTTNFAEIKAELSKPYINWFIFILTLKDKATTDNYKISYFNNNKKIIQVFYKIISFCEDTDFIDSEKYKRLLFEVYKVFGYSFNMKSIVEYSFTKWGQAILSFEGNFCTNYFKYVRLGW